MALEVFFKDDIRQGLVSVTVAMLSTAVAHGGTNVEYCRGILDALRAQVLNYGIPWSGVVTELQAALVDAGRGEMLELLLPALPCAAC
jgi:hypothetical protein